MTKAFDAGFSYFNLAWDSLWCFERTESERLALEAGMAHTKKDLEEKIIALSAEHWKEVSQPF